MTGGAYAATTSVKTVTAYVDGELFYTQKWPPEGTTNTSGTPPGPSPPRAATCCRRSVEDWAGVVTESDPVTVTVATASPEVDISPLVLTAKQGLPGPRVRLSGRLAGAAGFASVLARVDGEPWQAAAVIGDGWQLPWPVGSGGNGARHEGR